MTPTSDVQARTLLLEYRQFTQDKLFYLKVPSTTKTNFEAKLAEIDAVLAASQERCQDCKARNVLLLAMSGHLDKVTTEHGYNGVECARLEIERLKAALAAQAPQPQEPFDYEKRLRLEWWMGHGCPFSALYGDDGEMQCNAGTCMKDFKREPMDVLMHHVEMRRLSKVSAALQLAASPAPAVPRQEWQPIKTHPREASSRFLVCSNFGVREASVAMSEQWGRFDTLLLGPCTHWMPLPLPPVASHETPPQKELK